MGIMGKVTSLFVRKVMSVIDTDRDKAPLWQSVGVDPSTPTDLAQMVQASDYYDFLENVVSVDRDGITLPLRAGSSMRCDDYGVFGFAWKTALHLRGSYERAERYARVLTSVSTYSLERDAGGAFMHLNRDGDRSLGMRISNEATLASLMSISQQVCSRKFQPIAVYFKHEAPKSVTAHERFFGCPVYFATDRDAIHVSEETLNIPNRQADTSISNFFDTKLEEEVSKIENESSLEHRVRSIVSESLCEGIPMLHDIARHLGMSGRTLQRRLSELGFSYQSLIDDARRQMAKHLLVQTDLSLAEITFMTGFSDQSAFTRAFKRWAGQTPRLFRSSRP